MNSVLSESSGIVGLGYWAPNAVLGELYSASDSVAMSVCVIGGFDLAAAGGGCFGDACYTAVDLLCTCGEPGPVVEAVPEDGTWEPVVVLTCWQVTRGRWIA